MHHAPSVTYPVGRCRFYAGALMLLALVGVVVLGAWWCLATSPAATTSGWVGAVGWLAWTGFAAWSWQRSPTGQLGWRALARSEVDAPRGLWFWHSASCPEGAPLSRVEIALDLQGRALLRLHNADGVARWVWVEQDGDPAHWGDLRRALVAERA